MRNNNINDPLPLAMSHSEQNRFIGFESNVVALWRTSDGKLREHIYQGLRSCQGECWIV
jgi:hypothetical protein